MDTNHRFKENKTFFSTIPNEVINSKSISLDAKGLYSCIYYYLTIPGWKLYKSFIINEFRLTSGKSHFDTVWKELKDNNLLKVTRFYNGNNGIGYEYELLNGTEEKTIEDNNQVHENGLFKGKKKNFTIVNNNVITDKNLSMAATGLYSVICHEMNKPNWIVYKETIYTNCKEGKRKFAQAWNELINRGYLKVEKKKDERGYFCYEYSISEFSDDNPESHFPYMSSNGMSNDKVESEDVEFEDVDKPGMSIPCSEIPFNDNPEDINSVNIRKTGNKTEKRKEKELYSQERRYEEAEERKIREEIWERLEEAEEISFVLDKSFSKETGDIARELINTVKTILTSKEDMVINGIRYGQKENHQILGLLFPDDYINLALKIKFYKSARELNFKYCAVSIYNLAIEKSRETR